MFLEAEPVRDAAISATLQFFSQDSDDVRAITPIAPLTLCEFDSNSWEISLYSLPEIVVRATGLSVAAVALIYGVSLIVDGRLRG